MRIEEEDGELLRGERSTGYGMRQIPRGQNVDENNVHARFEDGVLEIVASQAGAEPRRKDEGRYQVTAAGGRRNTVTLLI